MRKLEVMIENGERLDEQVTYNQLVETLEEAGLGWVVEGAAEWEAAPEHLVHWFRNAWFERMLHELLDSREPLRRFNQPRTQDILRFRELDELLFLSTASGWRLGTGKGCRRWWVTVSSGFSCASLKAREAFANPKTHHAHGARHTGNQAGVHDEPNVDRQLSAAKFGTF